MVVVVVAVVGHLPADAALAVHADLHVDQEARMMT